MVVEAPFFVSPARSSRRQEGVLLQGHPRPWPVAKPRTFGSPAPKVQGTYAVRDVPGFFLAFSHIRGAGILPPPAFFFQAEDGIRDDLVTGVQTCALPI